MRWPARCSDSAPPGARRAPRTCCPWHGEGRVDRRVGRVHRGDEKEAAMTDPRKAAGTEAGSGAGAEAGTDAGLLAPTWAGAPVESEVTDEAWLRAMMDVEAALARAQAQL